MCAPATNVPPQYSHLAVSGSASAVGHCTEFILGSSSGFSFVFLIIVFTAVNSINPPPANAKSSVGILLPDIFPAFLPIWSNVSITAADNVLESFCRFFCICLVNSFSRSVVIMPPQSSPIMPSHDQVFSTLSLQYTTSQCFSSSNVLIYRLYA